MDHSRQSNQATVEKRSSDESREDMVSEDDFLLQQHDFLAHSKAKILTIPRVLLVLMVVVLALNVGLLVTLSAKVAPKCEGMVDYYLQTSKGKMPPTATRIYHDFDDDFLDHNLTVATRFWAGLFPPGNGIIGLTSSEVKELGVVQSIQGVTDPTKSIYLVAAFHQLHCLSVLRSQTIKLWKNPDFSIKDATYYHTMHCVDVMRQLIMCAADGTLIFKREEDKFPGEAGQRICRNFDALTQWTWEHHYISADDPPFHPPR